MEKLEYLENYRTQSPVNGRVHFLKLVFLKQTPIGNSYLHYKLQTLLDERVIVVPRSTQSRLVKIENNVISI